MFDNRKTKRYIFKTKRIFSVSPSIYKNNVIIMPLKSNYNHIVFYISLYSDLASKQGQYFFHFLVSLPQMSLCPMMVA